MEQVVKQGKLDGKKKFTATISTVVVGFVGLLVTSGMFTEQAASQLVQILALALPIGAGFVYDIIQGTHDVKKEAVKKVEIEQRFLMEKEKPVSPITSLPAKRVDFKALTSEAKANLTVGEQTSKAPVGLYYALINEAREVSFEARIDVWEYAQLVEDAAHKKFQAIHKFRLDDPDLANILQTIGKCSYSNVDAYVAYEGKRTALEDVRNAQAASRCALELVQLDVEDSWKGAGDTSLYGIYFLACHIVSLLK